jgi:hypothetical protein
MPVEVDTPTRKRVVICCILQPVVDEVNRAMREE